MRRYALETGNLPDGGVGEQKAFPCIVPPVSRLNDRFESATTTAEFSAAWGPLVPANSVRRYAVILDNDYNYKLLWIKYLALYTDGNGLRYSYDPAGPYWGNSNLIAFINPYPSSAYPWADPLYRYIRVKLHIRSVGERCLYGDSRDPITKDQLPLPVDCIQGNEYGIGQLRTPYLINREGTVEFEFTNTHTTKALTVHFAMYGMKVRV